MITKVVLKLFFHILTWHTLLAGVNFWVILKIVHFMNLSLSRTCTHARTKGLFVDEYHVRISLSIKQFTCSPTSIILSYGQTQTLHIDCPSSPSALDSLVPAEALNNWEGQTWGPIGCSRTHQPPPTDPQTNPQASLSAAELWKQLCSHNRVCAQTQLMFFVASKAIWYTILWNMQTQSHAHACPHVHSQCAQIVLRWNVQDTTLLSCQNLKSHN